MHIKPKVGAIPIGRLTTDDIRKDLETIKQVLNQAEFKVIIAGPVFDQIEVIDAAQKLRKDGIDLLLLIPLHGAASEQQLLAAETCQTFTVIWSLPPRYSLPSGAIAYGALVDKGFKVKYIYGSPGPQIRDKIEQIARVAFTINRLKESRIGVVGRVLAIIVSSHYDQNLLRDILGPYIVNVNIADIQDALNKVSDDELEDLMKKISDYTVTASSDLVKKAARLHLAIKKVVEHRRLDAIALECWSELFRLFKINPCLGFIEDTYAISCEGDAVGAVLVLMLRYLTSKSPTLLDVFTLEGDLLTMAGHCSAPASLADGGDIIVCERTPPAMLNMKDKVIAVRPEIKWDKVSILRISGRRFDRVHMSLGEIVEVDRREAMELKIRLLGNVDEFIVNMHGHHYAVAPGDLRSQMELLCEWLGLRLIVT